MATIPTIAESRAAMVQRCQITRQSVAFDNAEGSSNITDVVKFRVPSDLTTPLTGGAISGQVMTYLCFKAFSSGDYPTANVGDIVKVLKVDSSHSTTAIYDAQIWLNTAAGWVQLTTATPPKTVVPVAATDANQTPTGAALVAAEIFYMTPTANRTFTLPAATDIYAAISGAATNVQFSFRVVNAVTATYKVSVVCPGSITNQASAASLDVSAATSGSFYMNFTSPSAANLFRG